MVLEQPLLVDVLVVALVLQERSSLREERAVVVARAVALCEVDELAEVKTAAVSTALVLVVVSVLVIVAKVVVVVVVLTLLLLVVVVQEALGHIANLVEVEAGHFEYKCAMSDLKG